MVNRDAHLNLRAQTIALTKEINESKDEIEKLINAQRFETHYQVLTTHREEIEYLDQKIQNIFDQKIEAVKRHMDFVFKEASKILKGACDIDPANISDKSIQFYDKGIEQLQTRRAAIWHTHRELHEFLLSHEQAHNQKINLIYLKNKAIIEKIYLRNIDTDTYDFPPTTLFLRISASISNGYSGAEHGIFAKVPLGDGSLVVTTN